MFEAFARAARNRLEKSKVVAKDFVQHIVIGEARSACAAKMFRYVIE